MGIPVGSDDGSDDGSPPAGVPSPGPEPRDQVERDVQEQLERNGQRRRANNRSIEETGRSVTEGFRPRAPPAARRNLPATTNLGNQSGSVSALPLGAGNNPAGSAHVSLSDFERARHSLRNALHGNLAQNDINSIRDQLNESARDINSHIETIEQNEEIIRTLENQMQEMYDRGGVNGREIVELQANINECEKHNEILRDNLFCSHLAELRINKLANSKKNEYPISEEGLDPLGINDSLVGGTSYGDLIILLIFICETRDIIDSGVAASIIVSENLDDYFNGGEFYRKFFMNMREMDKKFNLGISEETLKADGELVQLEIDRINYRTQNQSPAGEVRGWGAPILSGWVPMQPGVSRAIENLSDGTARTDDAVRTDRLQRAKRRREGDAATVLQAAWRGKKGRDKINKDLQAELDEQEQGDLQGEEARTDDANVFRQPPALPAEPRNSKRRAKIYKDLQAGLDEQEQGDQRGEEARTDDADVFRKPPPLPTEPRNSKRLARRQRIV